ncbi:RtcB family protein [Nanoarchaeota archaeon]
MDKSQKPQLNKVSEFVWEVPTSFKKGMLVPARLYGSKGIVDALDMGVYDQVTNVASLPGIQNFAICMPDGHSGYGFPIGGVAAFDTEEGIISPGGIGFDINCGVRLLSTNLTIDDVKPKLKETVNSLFGKIPAGVGGKSTLRPDEKKFKDIQELGAKWCVENGYGWEKDLKSIEDNGCLTQADSSKVSQKAKSRGISQIGTLGSGNHYLEIQRVGEIFDKETANKFGIKDENQITIMIHCGSRGYGHQIGTDYLRSFNDIMPKYKLKVLDRELACAPFQSEEGQDYFKAMACAANAAFANRQMIMHNVRSAFESIFNKTAEDMEMNLVYDVAHNIAKVEKHKIDGKMKDVVVHRKGATRSFGPGRVELGEQFKETGQPVIIGGSMETGSYLLVGTDTAMDQTFGSTAHGAGRVMSRSQAKREFRGDELQKDMEKKGIFVKAVSMPGLAEEAGKAYKNISEVIDTIDKAGISRKIVRFDPIGNIKG